MQKATEPEYGIPDDENPEWTAEDFRRAKSFHEMPLEYQRAAARASKRDLSEMQETSRKAAEQREKLRLSPEVMQALRATGPGWQERADDVLRKAFVHEPEPHRA